jgi:hypothetical protein
MAMNCMSISVIFNHLMSRVLAIVSFPGATDFQKSSESGLGDNLAFN